MSGGGSKCDLAHAQVEFLKLDFNMKRELDLDNHARTYFLIVYLSRMVRKVFFITKNIQRIF